MDNNKGQEEEGLPVDRGVVLACITSRSCLFPECKSIMSMRAWLRERAVQNE